MRGGWTRTDGSDILMMEKPDRCCFFNKRKKRGIYVFCTHSRRRRGADHRGTRSGHGRAGQPVCRQLWRQAGLRARRLSLRLANRKRTGFCGPVRTEKAVGNCFLRAVSFVLKVFERFCRGSIALALAFLTNRERLRDNFCLLLLSHPSRGAWIETFPRNHF